jgi:prokaryotic ubiquitin-like protein Pup
MPARERVEKRTTEARREDASETTKKVDTKEELKDDIDALLDEIDGVLEENAEEFVKGYVQKGGE